VDRHPILEPGAEDGVHVRMGRPAHSAVLMDCENALGAANGATERLVDGVAHHALGLKAVEPLEALRRGVVHGHDEAEVGRIPEPLRIARRARRMAGSSPRNARYRSPIPKSSRRRPSLSPPSRWAM
jgi:hypothetical protein